MNSSTRNGHRQTLEETKALPHASRNPLSKDMDWSEVNIAKISTKRSMWLRPTTISCSPLFSAKGLRYDFEGNIGPDQSHCLGSESPEACIKVHLAFYFPPYLKHLAKPQKQQLCRCTCSQPALIHRVERLPHQNVSASTNISVFLPLFEYTF